MDEAVGLAELNVNQVYLTVFILAFTGARNSRSRYNLWHLVVVVEDEDEEGPNAPATCNLPRTTIMKYLALLSGGKDSCYNLLHCSKQGHELVAAASLHPPNGQGIRVCSVTELCPSVY